jgi:hypothetical protein
LIDPLEYNASDEVKNVLSGNDHSVLLESIVEAAFSFPGIGDAGDGRDARHSLGAA